MGDAHTLRRVAVVACLGVSGAGLLAQSAEQPLPQAPSTSLRTAPTEAEKSTWRTTVPWAESSDAARTPRVRRHLYHQEYLSRVTPEAFRRSALGAAPQITWDPGTAIDRFLRAWRTRQERRTSERVDRERAYLNRKSGGNATTTTAAQSE